MLADLSAETLREVLVAAVQSKKIRLSTLKRLISSCQVVHGDDIRSLSGDKTLGEGRKPKKKKHQKESQKKETQETQQEGEKAQEVPQDTDRSQKEVTRADKTTQKEHDKSKGHDELEDAVPSVQEALEDTKETLKEVLTEGGAYEVCQEDLLRAAEELQRSNLSGVVDPPLNLSPATLTKVSRSELIIC